MRADPVHARLDPALARRAAAAGAVQRDALRRQGLHLHRPRRPALQALLAGVGERRSCSGHRQRSVAVFAIIGFDMPAPASRPTGTRSRRDKIAAVVAIVFVRAARLRHDPRLVQHAACSTTSPPQTHIPGQPASRSPRRSAASCGWPPATISSACCRWASSRRSRKRARRATSSTGSRSTARSPGSEIGQNPDALLTSGEGLAEAFNVDAF